MSITNGIHHLGLSVSDLEGAVAFFTDALGFAVTNRNEDYPAAFLKGENAFITLWATDAAASRFDRRKNEGLHHVALSVTNLAELESLYQRLTTWPGVTIEKALTLMGPNSPVRHFFVTIPGGPRLEFIAQ